MPFGCLTLGEKKDYNSPSEVTDKYDLGQVVKSWVDLLWKCQRSAKFRRNTLLLFPTERNSVRYSGQKTGTPWRCTPAKSSTKRTGAKWEKLPRMRYWSWRCKWSREYVSETWWCSNNYAYWSPVNGDTFSKIILMTIIEVMITPQWQLNFVPSFAFPCILRVKHHNILQLVDAFETKKEYFIFLELWVIGSSGQESLAHCLCLPTVVRPSSWFRCFLCPELQAERCSTGSWTKGTTLRGTPVTSWGKCWRP